VKLIISAIFDTDKSMQAAVKTLESARWKWQAHVSSRRLKPEIVKSRKIQRQFVRPIVRSAIKGLVSYVPETKELLSPSAWVDLVAHLERWLLTILQPVLASKLAIATTHSKASHSRDQVFSISLDVNASNLSAQQLFELFPGAKETVEAVGADWLRAQRMTAARLQRDWGHLLSMLTREATLRVKHVTPGLSDPHERGQTVAVLEFAGGGRLVYKPRSCEGERIWFSALEWLNREGFQPSFYIPQFISRGNYCWMSFVEHRGCDSKRAVREFYFRWGAQAAIAQLLGCADLHRQNWIASGEGPVLIDAEMLGDAFSRRNREDAHRHLHPLLRTGLLPLFANDGVAGYSGIAPFDPSGSKKDAKTFWPTYRGRSELPVKYVSEIVEGFVAASRFVCDSSRRKLCEQLITQAAHRASLRVLKRATIQYRRILDESLQPAHMQKRGQRFSYLLKRCGRGRIDAIEARCLFRCSVPRFIKNTRHRKTRRSVPELSAMLESQNVLEARLRGEEASVAWTRDAYAAKKPMTT
jgi:lantibiotic modifying enzyme